MRTLTLIAVLATLSLLIYSFAEKENRKQIEYLGQLVPPDMEFIAGNDSIPAFFISKSQETNLNWVIYLEWLERVYVDYPQVVKLATPHNVEQSELYRFNDPILRGQLRNPAFAYYPVTGVDWNQIQNYLCWKTDRVNESVLIRLGYQGSNPDQVNEDSYNYEAYMAQQYEGFIPRHAKRVQGKPKTETLKDYYSIPQNYYDQTFGKVYPFLLPGYRLPTEEEWEYATNETFQNKEINRGETYPYGDKYFVLDYLYKDFPGLYWGLPKKQHILFTNYIDKAGTYEPADLNRIKGGTTYDNSVYGVYNMGNNVKEWMMDEYSSRIRHYPDVASVYTRNGFILAADSLYCDKEGNILEKDSLGRMYYRTMGVAGNGNDFRVMQYHYRIMRTYETSVPNPDSLKVKLAQIEQIKAMSSGYLKYEGYGYYAPYYFEIKKRGDEWENLKYYTVGTKDTNGKIRPWLYLDTNKILNRRGYVKERMFITTQHWEYVAVDSINRNRVVKSGTWKNPSTTARESMKETDASPDVGFRTVIPYMGIPIDKKNRVKWK